MAKLPVPSGKGARDPTDRALAGGLVLRQTLDTLGRRPC